MPVANAAGRPVPNSLTYALQLHGTREKAINILFYFCTIADLSSYTQVSSQYRLLGKSAEDYVAVCDSLGLP